MYLFLRVRILINNHGQIWLQAYIFLLNYSIFIY